MHLVKHSHFLSREEDGGHTIRSAIAENPCWRQIHGSVCYRTGVIANQSFTLQKFYIAENRDFRCFFCYYDLDLDLMTFIYKLDSYSLERWAKINFLRQGFQKLSSDTQTGPTVYTTPLSGWSIKISFSSLIQLEVEQGLTSHQTDYRSYRGRVFTGHVTQTTVSKHWRKIGPKD